MEDKLARVVIGFLLLTAVVLAGIGEFQSRVIDQQRNEIISLVQAGAIRGVHVTGGRRG